MWKYSETLFLTLPAQPRGLVSYSFLLATLLRLIFQTWSQEPLTLPQPVIQPVWGQRSCRSHRVQKGHFRQKRYSSYRLHDMVMWLMYMHQLDPSTKVIGLKIHPGSLGSKGSKGNFHQKCYFSYRLHDMVTWLMYMHQLNTLYKNYWFKNSPRVIWGHRGQKVIFIKNASSPSDYMTWSRDSCICIS